MDLPVVCRHDRYSTTTIIAKLSDVDFSRFAKILISISAPPRSTMSKFGTRKMGVFSTGAPGGATGGSHLIGVHHRKYETNPQSQIK